MTPRRKFLLWSGLLALAVAGVFLVLCVGEVSLRLRPDLLPTGIYGAGAMNEELGMGVHGVPVIYNKVRFVRRAPNRDGFLDIDHERAKAAQGVRIGFFGDSYVEAAQVSLPEVFYRRLGDRLAGRGVETLGFGMSGWGTLHGMLAHRVYGRAYDLDVVVYVFVENDPGDSLLEIQNHQIGSKQKPFATLRGAPPGFEVVWLTEGPQAHWYLAPLKWLQTRSLLLQVVLARYEMLKARGIQVRANAREASMTERASSAVPDSNAMPDTWPDAYRQAAAELLRRVLRQWRDEVHARGAEFYVLYVPRGEAQLEGRIPIAATWRPWLGQVTTELEIPLVDPSQDLSRRIEAGDSVFDDHFSPVGHDEIAALLVRLFDGRGAALPKGARGPREAAAGAP